MTRTTRIDEEESELSFGKIIMFTVIVIFIVYSLGSFYGVGCELRDMLSDDKYCYFYSSSNLSGFDYKSHELRSHAQDIIDQKNQAERLKAEIEQREAELQCYNNGFDINLSFDPIKDYGLSCRKMDYINDHLIDYVIDGGYIRGHYSGFLSSGSIEGHMNIVKRGLFEDKLTKSLFYHIDCNNQTSGETIIYYDEKEFIKYYVDNCIK